MSNEVKITQSEFPVIVTHLQKDQFKFNQNNAKDDLNEPKNRINQATPSIKSVSNTKIIKKLIERPEFFAKVCDEAIMREKSNSINNFKIYLHCDTQFGQDVFIVGSALELGNWNTLKAKPLSWTPGNYWVCTIPIFSDIKSCEFKFFKKENGAIEWEKCNNRKFKAYMKPNSPPKITLDWNDNSN